MAWDWLRPPASFLRGQTLFNRTEDFICFFIMATFVSLVTCHHCPVASPRRGLVYADSLSVLSRRLPGGPQWPPGSPQCPPGPRLLSRHHCRLHRADPPESLAVVGSRPPASMRHLLVTHLRKLLTLSPAHHRRGLRLPG